MSHVGRRLASSEQPVFQLSSFNILGADSGKLQTQSAFTVYDDVMMMSRSVVHHIPVFTSHVFSLASLLSYQLLLVLPAFT